MIFSPAILGALLALGSGALLGGADYAGGRAAFRASPYQVLVLTGLAGLVVLSAAALLTGETFPSPAGLAWSAACGVAGSVGLGALYRALSIGRAAVVAPISAVISAGIPVVFAAFTEGSPGPLRLLGFLLAAVGIWVVSSAPGGEGGERGTGGRARQAILLAVLAGVGFGFFFVFLSLIERGKFFTPFIVARAITVLASLALVKVSGLPLPRLTANPPALLAGVLDSAGNLLYILAIQLTRLDVAAVLSSLYPASTVLLSALLLKERVSRPQLVGVALCLAAVVLVAV